MFVDYFRSQTSFHLVRYEMILLGELMPNYLRGNTNNVGSFFGWWTRQ